MTEFTKRLINWYYENKRDLPFRDINNPYKIWVSEIMAQQTQIIQMIPYYNRWIERFPDVQTLASAPIEEVLKYWEGLGYYNRARNLHKGANFIIDHFNGIIPDTKEDLLKIPGIGDYTSSAIASIAFNKPEIAIDGNVKRVMTRYLNYTENANAPKCHRIIKDFLYNELINSEVNPSDFTQALMELGALVYTPSNTLCSGSPFKEMCAGYRGENVGTIPYFPPKKKNPEYDFSVWINIQDDKILVSNDDRDGLMIGLLRLPQTIESVDTKPLTKLTHKYSHLTWNLKVYNLRDDVEVSEHWYYVPISSLQDLPIITAHKKILKNLNLL
nr:putative A/G-specific adenine glycosylase [uncultured bacterium]